MDGTKICPRCRKHKPKTVEYFYIQRARGAHKKPGWQSYCRPCWIEINKENKLRRKIAVYIDDLYKSEQDVDIYSDVA